jgi:hypothetical protein
MGHCHCWSREAVDFLDHLRKVAREVIKLFIQIFGESVTDASQRVSQKEKETPGTTSHDAATGMEARLVCDLGVTVWQRKQINYSRLLPLSIRRQFRRKWFTTITRKVRNLPFVMSHHCIELLLLRFDVIESLVDSSLVLLSVDDLAMKRGYLPSAENDRCTSWALICASLH